MEPIFENVYTDTEEMFREQYNRSGWVMRAGWVAVFLCLIVYYGIVLLTEQSLFYLLIVLIYLAYLVYMLHVPWSRAKRHMKNELTEYGGTLPQTVVQFFENEVTAKYGRTTNTISYEQITDIIVLNHTIILNVKKVTGIPISPKHFTKGSVEELYRFLQVKCPGVKLPGWKW